MFKVKVTAKVQNVSECLSGRYLVYHRTFVFGLVMQQQEPECCGDFVVVVVVAVFKVKMAYMIEVFCH